jgi:hypothetical protein
MNDIQRAQLSGIIVGVVLASIVGVWLIMFDYSLRVQRCIEMNIVEWQVDKKTGKTTKKWNDPEIKYIIYGNKE